MGYVAVNVREDDLMNGIFVKGGTGFRGGDFIFHLHEEDYRRGVYVKGLRCEGKVVAHTWTDGDTNYMAASHLNSEDTNVVDVELYGGTKEQFDRNRKLHAKLCKTRGKTQGVFVHFPMQCDSCPDCTI